MSRETALYRLYDEGGLLLYVGISINPDRRFAQHSYEKDWWGEVHDHMIEWFPSRSAARRAEWRTIHDEAPLHNKQRPSDGLNPYKPLPGGWWYTPGYVEVACPCGTSEGVGGFEGILSMVGAHQDPLTEVWTLEWECQTCGTRTYKTPLSPLVEEIGRVGGGWRPRWVYG